MHLHLVIYILNLNKKKTILILPAKLVRTYMGGQLFIGPTSWGQVSGKKQGQLP